MPRTFDLDNGSVVLIIGSVLEVARSETNQRKKEGAR